jgi:hypothetical protein
VPDLARLGLGGAAPEVSATIQLALLFLAVIVMFVVVSAAVVVRVLIPAIRRLESQRGDPRDLR